MTVQLATGNTGKAVTSASDRRLYAGMFGTECYVHEIGKMCTASLDGPNKLVVQNGSLMINGAHVDLLGNTEFTIPVGLQAQKRATLCGVLYTASADGHEEAAQKTYTGEAVSDGEVPDPEYPNSNLLVGGTTETFMPLYRVVTDGINALEPVPMFNVVAPYAKFRNSQSQPVLIGATSCQDDKGMEDVGDLGDFNWYILACLYGDQPRILSTILIPREYMIAASSWPLAHTARHNSDYSAGWMCVKGRIKACVKGSSRAEVWGLA